jgi:hypothetical protein
MAIAQLLAIMEASSSSKQRQYLPKKEGGKIGTCVEGRRLAKRSAHLAKGGHVCVRVRTQRQYAADVQHET